MYKNYIFDLYGTLVDISTDERKPSLWRILTRYMALQGASYAPQELRRAYCRTIETVNAELWNALQESRDLAGIDFPEIEVDFAEVIPRLYGEKGVAADADMIRHWALIFRALSLKQLRLFPGAWELLTELRRRGMGVYLLSNAQRLFTEPELRSLKIYDLFDDVFLSSDIGFKKPSGKFYKALLEKHALCPDTCVMIGNDWQADAWGAHNNGLASMYLHTAQSPELEGELPPDCRRLSDLSEVLCASPK